MLIQKCVRPDSIVAHFCSQAAPRRLLQQNLPQADSCTATNDGWHQAKRASVDDVICSHQHCWRCCQTECFHLPLINGETENGWLLEWQIGRRCPHFVFGILVSRRFSLC